MRKYGNRKKWKGFVWLLVVIQLLTMMCAMPVSAATLLKPEKEKVRVGFFEFDGYHMKDGKGLMSGYGYDFVQMASRYNDWDLEYVGYENSWSDMQEMLERGEIDLLTSAHKTPDREEKFDFSSQSIGSSTTILSMRSGDSRYTIGEPSSYKDMRVGMIADSTRNERFLEFAEEKQFTFTPVYYESSTKMLADLQTGGIIDAVVTSSLRSVENETILERFSPEGFYAIVKKGNEKLLGEVNYAINQMDIYSSGWRTLLTEEYYTPKSGDAISFSGKEMEYLKQLRDSGAVLRVASNPDLAPYSYCENGTLKGIAPDLFEEIAARLELPYQYLTAGSYAEYRNMILNDQVDVDLTCFSDYSLAEQHQLSLTDSYLSTIMARVTRIGRSGNLQTAAVLKDSGLQNRHNEEMLGNLKITEYDSLRECVASVLNGENDVTYLYAYTAQKAEAEDARNRISVIQMPDYPVKLAIGVNRKLDHRVLSLLNKGVQSIRTRYAQEVVQTELQKIKPNTSFIATVYDNPGTALVILGVFLGAIFISILYVSKTRSARREQEQAKKLSRFMGYVCELNEMVMEVNLDTGQSLHYYVENGELKSREEPYRFLNYDNYESRFVEEDFVQLTAHLTEEKMMDLIRNNGSMYFEARATGADGVKRWYGYTLRAIPRDLQHPKNFILFKKDIDESKQQEEEHRHVLEDALETARNASKAKGQFLSSMSHEIRTPLNAIIGYMDIAQNSADNPDKMMHCVENGDLAAKHLLNIINDVLDISSIESGKMKIAHEEFDLKTQIGTISTIFFNQAKNKNVNFDVTIDGLTEEWVVGDSLRVNQVLMNLLSNAVKFTPAEGKVTLSVSQMRLTDQQVFLKFEVSDTGIGMSEEYQKKMFTPFEQENASTARKYGGSGLGLSITGNLVSMMGGSIKVQSKQGEGSRFIVSLPFDRSAANHTGEGVPQDYSRVRALIVDDEQSSCDYIKSLLKRCGVKSDTVLSGDAAIRQIMRRMGTDYAYDLCIMDWNMPDMDGIETARRIREECHAEIPIIIATAYDVTEYADEAKKLGVEKIIAKPLFQSTMFDLLVSHYGKYQPVSSKKETNYSLKGMRILLAEDNAMNMEIAQEILSKAGILVDGADDGQEAYDLFTKAAPGTYQAVLMDVQMPVLDGYQATQKIRSSEHPEAKTIPIIAMTANAFAEDVAAALASGMNGHVSKPIDYDKLFRVLSEYRKEEK